jgi:site-specific DNA recombinase
MRTVRLRLVPHIHPHIEARTELLSLHRFGWISTAERAALYESANQTRLSRSVVWSEIIRLLEDPGLIQTEIDRRREAAQKTNPWRKREEELRREQARVEKSSERLVTACQEGLLTLPQLRQRMPPLQKQTQAVESELQSLKTAAVDDAKYLQLAEGLASFRSKLRMRAEVLDIAVRQQILRPLVQEVLVLLGHKRTI